MTWWTWPGLRGAVLESVPGELVDIGAGGCSLETSTPLSSGSFGFVEVDGADGSIAEVARVCQVIERPGAAARFLVRLEFVPIALPTHAGASECLDVAPAASLAAAEEKAGSSLTLVRRRNADGTVERVSSARNDAESHADADANAQEDALAERLK